MIQSEKSSEAHKAKAATNHSSVESPVCGARRADIEPNSKDGMAKDEGFMTSDLGPVGSLHISASGHARYMHFAVQWESLVMESPAAEVLGDLNLELLDDDDDLQIPLAPDGSISRSCLLAVLPPQKCCDALKDRYFRVFAPVSALTGLARKAKG